MWNLIQAPKPKPKSIGRSAHIFGCCVFAVGIAVASGFAGGTGMLNGQEIVAHRGASHAAPENTLAAFMLAWQKGADAIEGDFYLSADGKIVCIHDKDTARTAPNQKTRIVARTDAKELQTIDVGSWKNPKYRGERIPTLTEVLEIVPSGKKILIEIKCGPEIVPVLKTVLEESSVPLDQVVIISFSQDVVTAARRAIPDCKVNWLTSYKTDEDGNTTPTQEQVLERLRESGATGLGTQGDRNVINSNFVQAIKDAGFELHVWTINKPEDAIYFRQLGVDSITTDKPELIRSVIKVASQQETLEPALSGR